MDESSCMAYLWGSRKEAKYHLDAILTRKHRKNGYGRHILRLATRSGKPVEYRRGSVRILIKRVEIAGIFFFDVVCVEGMAECQKLLRARAKPEDNRVKVPLGERSKLNWWKEKLKPRVAVPQVARFKRHLKHTMITWKQAITAIARAIRGSANALGAHLQGQWQAGLAAQEGTVIVSYAYGAAFRFRIELARGPVLGDNSVVMGVYTTNDNRAPAYRRFRKSLKRLCRVGHDAPCDRETRLAQRKHREAIRRKLAA